MSTNLRRALAGLALASAIFTACGGDEAATESVSSDAPTTTEAETMPDAEPETAEIPASPTEVVGEDQTSDGTTITAASITLPAPGFLTVHADDNGAPGPIIGHNPTLLPQGQSTDVTVDLYEPLTETATVWLMPHIDMDGDGQYTFNPPDELIDGPGIKADGDVAVTPITINIG